MKDIAIQVENLSKAYQLGQIGTGTISRDLERFVVTKILGKEDPFLKIGQTNDRTIKGDSDIVWSLKDINFDIQQGDAVGIIGKNGAGKSTLLKLLSRVTSPTTGNIKVKGRIASLLEVGTGFHPELTGRENIFLNGAILGMRKHEIKRKFDEIVAFSGVERYIDTPVKRYSSGMYVRLAFAVAAHLESEILIVDEVLAVGDAEFQKKCLGKMGEVSKGEGRTVLFVSHNMAAVENLCSSSILLKNGLIDYIGATNDTINRYFSGIKKGEDIDSDYIESVEVSNQIDNFCNVIKPYDDIFIKIKTKKGFWDENIYYAVFVYTKDSVKVFALNTNSINKEIAKNTKHFNFHIKNHNLNEGEYNVEVITAIKNEKRLERKEGISSFTIENGGLILNENRITNHFGLVYFDTEIICL